MTADRPGRYTLASPAHTAPTSSSYWVVPGLLLGGAYPGALDKLELKTTDIRSCAVHVDDNITTSRGPGTAMDFALSLVEQLSGSDKRDEVEAGLAR